jgi:hypothetical protein
MIEREEFECSEYGYSVYHRDNEGEMNSVFSTDYEVNMTSLNRYRWTGTPERHSLLETRFWTSRNCNFNQIFNYRSHRDCMSDSGDDNKIIGSIVGNSTATYDQIRVEMESGEFVVTGFYLESETVYKAQTLSVGGLNFRD